MIPLEAQNGFVMYIGIWFLFLAVLWAREIWRVKSYDWDLSKDRISVCDKCHYTFFLKDQENITRCPKCNEVCFSKKNKRF